MHENKLRLIWSFGRDVLNTRDVADFRGESICRLSWKVFADFGGNNARISLESPYLVFQGEMTAR